MKWPKILRMSYIRPDPICFVVGKYCPKIEWKIGEKVTLPCGIAFRANNSILVESVFHGAKSAKMKITYRG